LIIKTTGNTIKLSSTVSFSGMFLESVEAGESITALDICYIKASDAKAYKLGTGISEANTSIAVVALETIASGLSGRFLLKGTITNTGWSLTVGNKIEIGSTAGQIAEAS
jgi:hypothetical protein